MYKMRAPLADEISARDEEAQPHPIHELREE
jgi:hypothetical protein